MSRSARAAVPRSVYPRASLAAAALALGRRARVGLAADGKSWRVEVGAEGRGDAAALLGEFLNEALSHALRQAALKESKLLVAAVAARLLSRGFPAAPADPLEQLEPQVRLDRAEEAAALLDRARESGVSRLREPRAAGPVPARALDGGKVLLAGPTGRAALLTAQEHAAFAGGLAAEDPLRERLAALGAVAGAADVEALARETIESGVLNWSGPATHILLVSARGEAMVPETAKAAVDFAFATPRPTLFLEFVDEDGRGWPAAEFGAAYARRRAEWAGRGLALSYRTPSRPPREREEFLRGHGVAVRAALSAGGAPDASALFGAARARVVVGRGAREPEAWADALSAKGISGVEWVPAEPAGDPAAARHFADFAARALARLIETHETSDLRDELAATLLNARPWEVRGADLVETLAYSPDGSVFSSEEGWALDADGEGDAFLLGHATSLRFADLPSAPVVPALLTALAREAQPLCGACAYRAFCLIPPSVHFRAQGSLSGRLPDSPRCAAHMALLDAVFSRLNDEKCLKALEKWGVDISRFTC